LGLGIALAQKSQPPQVISPTSNGIAPNGIVPSTANSVVFAQPYADVDNSQYRDLPTVTVPGGAAARFNRRVPDRTACRLSRCPGVTYAFRPPFDANPRKHSPDGPALAAQVNRLTR